MTLDLENYTIDEDSNGDLVVLDTNDNTVLTWDDTNGKWVLGSNAPLDISELIDGADVSHTGELVDNPLTTALDANNNDIDNVGALTTEQIDILDAADWRSGTKEYKFGFIAELAVEWRSVLQLDTTTGGAVCSVYANMTGEDSGSGNKITETGQETLLSGGDDTWGTAGATTLISTNIRFKVDDSDNTRAYIQVYLPANYWVGHASINRTIRRVEETVLV